MRVRLTDGQREVEIRAEGDDPGLLRQIERTARRLLVDLAPQPSPSPSAFGFGRQLDLDRVALDSTIEQADQDNELDHEDEDDDT
ncbi:hypothetical protein [Streptomyces lydicus]|uniref:hypothetical protein n=1 Tax=Streptomyces lydicus TaxID=47763 RepID=UPI001011FC32|nr:hypothetical protein [Streptomyces lydicus]MCZ1009918.1 hypothetical protein [Streptomyces lydicus]